ncbi:MAG: AIM24 family protein [Nitrososphaerales archaeon]
MFFEIKPGIQLQVREHQFLFSTPGINYTYFRVKGISNLLYGGTGMFIDVFQGTGLLALHGYGNTFSRNLASGESVDVEPGGFLYKDSSVKMETHSLGMKTGLFEGMTLMINRFTGSGTIGIQSMPFHLHTGE